MIITRNVCSTLDTPFRSICCSTLKVWCYQSVLWRV